MKLAIPVNIQVPDNKYTPQFFHLQIPYRLTVPIKKISV
jgi:hypothetical protein